MFVWVHAPLVSDAAVHRFSVACRVSVACSSLWQNSRGNNCRTWRTFLKTPALMKRSPSPSFHFPVKFTKIFSSTFSQNFSEWLLLWGVMPFLWRENKKNMSVRKTTQKNRCKFFEVLLSHTFFKKWRKFLPQSTLIVKLYFLEIFVRFIKSVWHCCKPIYFLGKLNYIGVGNQ